MLRPGVEHAESDIMVDEFFKQDPALIFEYDFLIRESALVSLCVFGKILVPRKGSQAKIVMFGRRDQQWKKGQRQARELYSRHTQDALVAGEVESCQIILYRSNFLSLQEHERHTVATTFFRE